MTQKIAVAILHGIGKQPPDFAQPLIAALQKRCQSICGSDLIFRPVYWSPALQPLENRLWDRLLAPPPPPLRGELLRRFLIDFLGDAFAYQIVPSDRSAYDRVHAIVADTLHDLAETAGADAPLCIIAHSLGTIIASNYIYDLQTESRRPIIARDVRAHMGDTPLERGETLALLDTLGSPLAIFSLRYADLGLPIDMPDPRLSTHYPKLSGQWFNFYDPDDVIGFPLKPLNAAYDQAVSADYAINVDNPLIDWNPASHLGYWSASAVLTRIAAQLIEIWQTVNPQAA